MRFFYEALFFPLRYPSTLSSHCSQVYPHSQITRSLPSLLHVHPFVALCFVSTVLLLVLLLLLFVLGFGQLHSLHPSPLYFLFASSRPPSCSLTSRPHCATHQYLFVSHVAVCLPLYHPVSLHPAKGFALSPRIYIIHPPSSFHCKTLHTPSFVYHPPMLPSP